MERWSHVWTMGWSWEESGWRRRESVEGGWLRFVVVLREGGFGCAAGL